MDTACVSPPMSLLELEGSDPSPHLQDMGVNNLFLLKDPEMKKKKKTQRCYDYFPQSSLSLHFHIGPKRSHLITQISFRRKPIMSCSIFTDTNIRQPPGESPTYLGIERTLDKSINYSIIHTRALQMISMSMHTVIDQQPILQVRKLNLIKIQ